MPGTPAKPLLWHFPISHFNEKVRWALDWKGIPHDREVLSGDYLPRVWWATGRRATLPVLHLDGRAIVDSTAILAALEERHPEPALYPADAAQRQRALDLEDWFDETIGHPVRTLLVPAIMEEGGAERTAEVMMSGMSERVKRAFRALHPVFQRFYYVRHGIVDAMRRAAPGVVLEGLERIALERGPEGYLVGGRFSVADLTAASLLAPLVRPQGTIWAELGDYPEAVRAFVEPLEDHAGSRWVREMYARHRAPSSVG